MRQIAQSIAKGVFSSRVPVKGTGDEVDQLAVTFNGMLGQIETVLCSMKEVNDNIAHDLRSPIARMRGTAKLMLTSKGTVKDYEAVVGRVVEECDGLLSMINTMLDISETEAGIVRLRLVGINAGEMARDVIDLFSPVAEDKRVEVNLRESGALSLHADAPKLQRVLSNLLDNALKYTPSGGSIIISAYGTDQAVHVIVCDTGIGMSKFELSHIFDRFYRGEKTDRNPATAWVSVWLGLSCLPTEGRLLRQIHPARDLSSRSCCRRLSRDKFKTARDVANNTLMLDPCKKKVIYLNVIIATSHLLVLIDFHL